MRLPSSLAPWSDSLTYLTPELATALGPLVRGLDRLVTDHETAASRPGSLDGFEGLTTRGHPELMLASEWLLADEAPDEFLRRAAQRELLHLAPAVRGPMTRGRVAMLADTGPRQAGAGRLVQLACMIVLHRRAAARGTQLTVGILGQQPGRWHTGELPELLRTWLTARRPVEPDADDVSDWTDHVAHADEMWTLTGPRLSARLGGRHRLIVSGESAWGELGATHVRVTCDGARAELALPPGPVAVRALRGGEFRRNPAAATAEPETAETFRFPMFPSSAWQILARGQTEAELVSIRVPRTDGQGPVRPRLHRLEGPVLAASALGNRLVAVIEHDRRLRVQVIGNPLGRVASVSVPIDAADLDMNDVERICGEGLSPLYYRSGHVLCRLGDDRWWRLEPPGGASPTDFVTVGPAPGNQFDQPHLVMRGTHGKRVSIQHISEPIDPEDGTVILGGGGYARSADGRTWHVVHPSGSRTAVTIESDSPVLGLLFDMHEPVLVTRGPGGLLIRLVRPRGTKTLTDWSATGTPAVIHPTLPLIAAVDTTGRLKAGNLLNGKVLLNVAAGA